MGSHADGVVFWGYDLGLMTDRETWEPTAPAWMYDPDNGPTDREWEDELAVRLGWTEVPFPDHLTFDWATRSHEREPDYQAYNAARKAKAAVLAAGPGVKMERYGHTDGDAAWYVAVDGTEHTATYDCVRLALDVQPDWRERADRFIELLELPKPDGEPGWFVTSSYG